ncbi:MAG: FtsQ-type POTRA domain-containing protein [Verrucomicrobiota bacterium]
MKRKSSSSRRKRNQKVLHVAVKQKRQSKKNEKMLWIGVGGVLALAVTGYFTHLIVGELVQRALYDNPDFAIEKIEINNTGSLNRTEVLAWAGVEKGQNLIRVNLPDVQKRLQQIPYIAGVHVERSLPSTLRITINERLPVARLMPYSPKGNLLAQYNYYIDSGGYVIRPKEGERLKPLPVITGISIDEVRVGEFMENEEVLSALNLLRAASYYGLKSKLDLRQIEIQPRRMLVVRTRDRGLIRFRTDHLDQQIKRLQTIFNHSQRNHKYIRTVDLTPKRNVPVTYF